jgi:hypothetical protein
MPSRPQSCQLADSANLLIDGGLCMTVDAGIKRSKEWSIGTQHTKTNFCQRYLERSDGNVNRHIKLSDIILNKIKLLLILPKRDVSVYA